MLAFLQRNAALLGILLLWFLVGSRSAVAFYGLGGLTVLLWWRRGMYFEILIGFFFILILSDNLRYTTDFAKTFKNVYMVLLGAIPLLTRQPFKPYSRLYLYIAPWLLVAFVGLLFSPMPTVALQKMLSYGLLFFAVPQMLLVATRQLGPEAVKDLLFFGLLLVLVGFGLYVFEPGVALSHGGRFRAIFGNPNGLGIFATLLLVLTVIGREYFKGLFSKNDLRWLILVSLVAIALSGSRTAIIAALLFLVFVRFFRASPLLGCIVFLVFAVGAEVVFSNLVAIVQALGLSAYLRVETLAEGSGRYIAWQFAWDSLQSHFWFGRGFAYDEWLMAVNQDYLNALGHQGGVHNTYLIVWLNTGIVGLLLFLRAYLLLFIRAAKNTPIAFPTLFLVLFSITLEPWLAASLNPFTILLLISLVVMTDEAFQPYLRGELAPSQSPSITNEAMV